MEIKRTVINIINDILSNIKPKFNHSNFEEIHEFSKLVIKYIEMFELKKKKYFIVENL